MTKKLPQNFVYISSIHFKAILMLPQTYDYVPSPESGDLFCSFSTFHTFADNLRAANIYLLWHKTQTT